MAATAAIKVRDLWTAFITALVTLFAALGLTGTASATRRTAGAPAAAPDSPAVPVAARTESGGSGDPGAGAGTGSAAGDSAGRTGSRGITGPRRERTVRASVPAQKTRNTRWNPRTRDRSLPPTIKQRIGAEAHGTSPSVRKLPALDTDTILGTGFTAAFGPGQGFSPGTGPAGARDTAAGPGSSDTGADASGTRAGSAGTRSSGASSAGTRSAGTSSSGTRAGASAAAAGARSEEYAADPGAPSAAESYALRPAVSPSAATATPPVTDLPARPALTALAPSQERSRQSARNRFSAHDRRGVPARPSAVDRRFTVVAADGPHRVDHSTGDSDDNALAPAA
ncbi:DUF6344 domain-containing protein [Streptomyces sp. CAU 1734]|uniref:DUF6344 domain-containing protein n=1 Tax=Streptomyces sp. CAU 1734 TaxID=3140360 RepID=UPI003261052F